MGSYEKIPSSIRRVYPAALELNDDKCAICYSELREPVQQTACGHTFCGDCMMRYEFKSTSITFFSSFSFLTFFVSDSMLLIESPCIV